jgi:glycosyltransferase involved in cell wall biosynthesis
MKKHRIAFYLPALNGGGAERVVLTIAGVMKERGHDVELVLDRAGGELHDEATRQFKATVLHAPKTMLAAPRLSRWISASKVDVLVASLTHNNSVSIAARAMSSHRCALIAWEHNLFSSMPQMNDWRQDLGRICARFALPHADLVMAVSKAVSTELLASIPLKEDRVCIVYNPIPMPSASELSDSAPHPWLEDGQPPVIISAGRLTAQKDYKTLLRAFARIPEPARLIIIGEGECRMQLEAIVDQLGIGDRVLLPGFMPNPRTWISRARVFALSSLQEGFGNVIVEALGCGVPVVSTRSGGPPVEILDNGRFGALVESSDDAALAQAIMDTMQALPDKKMLMARAYEFRPSHIGDVFEQAVDQAVAFNLANPKTLAMLHRATA